METNVGSDNFQDRKIHRKGVFLPDLRPLFMAPRSRSQMFLTFASPPKDQDTDVRFPNCVYGNNESRDAEDNSNIQYIRWHFSEGWLYDFEKPKHTRAAAPQHATDHGDRGARGSSGSYSANVPGGCRIFANCCYSVRGCARGANLRPNLETTSGEEIPCPDLSLRSGRNTPFRGFSELGSCQNQHSSPHAVYTDFTVSESCIDQDLWPTSGYHKQWPQAEIGIRYFFSRCCLEVRPQICPRAHTRAEQQ